jgi:hypothetical protein
MSVERGEVGEAPASERMEWGLRLENAVAEAFADKTQRKVAPGKAVRSRVLEMPRRLEGTRMLSRQLMRSETPGGAARV